MGRAVDESLVGTTLGNYTLARQLGQGAMGVVFEGRSRAGARAAIKVLRHEVLKSPEHLSRFEREAKTLIAIEHPNVVRLLEVGSGDGLVWLVLELVEGETLAQRVGKGKLGTADATRVAIDLFRGLAAIHDRGIVHRDLKPANICGTTAGAWKISDFGLARRDEKEESIVLTQPGTLLGTPHYMSPEQCRGEATDARSDLYSAGATLYHVLAGEPPFMKGNLVGILQAHVQEAPEELTRRVPTVPRELAKLVHRLLAKAPADRPRSARECLQALGIKDLPPPERRNTPPPPGESREVREPLAPAPVTRPRSDRVVVAESPRVATSRAAAPPPAPEIERPRVPQRPVHVGPRWSRAVLPWTVGLAIGTGKVLLEFKPGGFALEPWLAQQLAKVPALAARVGSGDVVSFVEGWGLLLTPALFALGGWLVASRYVRDNAPRDALARSLLSRAYLRLRILRDEKSNPPSAAEALRDLGEPDAAARLLIDSGNGALAAEMLKRAGDVIGAGQTYERLKETHKAIECYVSAGLIERAAKCASDAGQHEEAGTLFVRARQVDKAVESYRKAQKPQAAVAALEDAGRVLDAAQELAGALKDGKAFKRLGPEERRLLTKRAAELFEKGGKPRSAGPVYEEAGEREKALDAFERGGAFEEAARVARVLGRHDRAAQLWDKARKPVEAARARAEGLANRGDHLEAGRVLDEAGDSAAAGEHYEQAEAPLEAARCFEAAGDLDRAAYLFARGKDHARAGLLYEKVKSWHEAARCWHAHGDHVASARAYERAPEPLSAADEYAHANALDEAARVLGSVPSTSPQFRESRARLGDLHAAANREEDVVRAYGESLPESAAVDEDGVRRLARLAEAHARLGRRDAARAVVARIRAAGEVAPDLAPRLAALESGAAPPPARPTGRVKAPGASGAPPAAARPAAAAAPAPRAPATPAPPPSAPASLSPAASAASTIVPPGPVAAPTTVKDPSALVGCEIDRYKLQAFLGEGATAWVFKAEHAFLKRMAAIKVLKPAISGGEGLAQRFLVEGQAVATLRHPNLIEVFDCGVTPDGSLWMALEFVAGVSLREALRQKAPFPVPQAARIGAGVLAGLAAAHAKQIVHRDLKPENILLAPGDRAKVVDFGIAKVLSGNPGDTTKQAFLGTPRYFSPEQALGKVVGPASDQYALGLVLYEMLVGEPPFHSATPVGYLTQHAGTPPPPLREKNPQVPEKLAEAVMRSLAKDPEARFPSAEAMRKVIVAFAPRAPNPSQSTSGD